MTLLPVLLVAVGAAAGALVAEQTLPPAEDPAPPTGAAGQAMDATAGPTPPSPAAAPDEPAAHYDDERAVVEFDRPLIVPVVRARRRQAVILMHVALDLPASAAPIAHAAEPRLRDGFLRVMLALAAGGTLDDGIGDPALLERVRLLLAERATALLPVDDVGVLVTEVITRPL